MTRKPGGRELTENDITAMKNYYGKASDDTANILATTGIFPDQIKTTHFWGGIEYHYNMNGVEMKMKDYGSLGQEPDVFPEIRIRYENKDITEEFFKESPCVGHVVSDESIKKLSEFINEKNGQKIASDDLHVEANQLFGGRGINRQTQQTQAVRQGMK